MSDDHVVSQAFDLLQVMEDRSKANAHGLPRQDLIEALITGVAVRIADVQLLLPMKELQEVLPLPQITAVPGTFPWVVGVTQLRGQLVTVLDVGEFFWKKKSKMIKSTRALVLNSSEKLKSLLVDQVYGMYQIAEKDILPAKKVPEALDPYVKGAVWSHGKEWLFLNCKQLFSSQVINSFSDVVG